MSKFSRWTPTLGVCFKWDSQKVLKIAHFGVFRHIGGTWGVQKHMYLKIYWVKVISSKNGDFWTPQCWEINFFRQNICMFDWLYTETYLLILGPIKWNSGLEIPFHLILFILNYVGACFGHSSPSAWKWWISRGCQGQVCFCLRSLLSLALHPNSYIPQCPSLCLFSDAFKLSSVSLKTTLD